MFFGYNTNGFAHHRLEDAIAVLAELGYQGVALTLDHNALNPLQPDLPGRAAVLRELLDEFSLRCVVETGARFLLDPRRKHQPTLLSADEDEREMRLDFLRDAVTVARELNADAVSFWSAGVPDPAPPDVLMDRLVAGCKALCDFADPKGVRLAFEPEPGMFIDTMDRFADLHRRVNRPAFGLTIDVGHLVCQGELPVGDHLRRWRDWLWNVHIEDMKRGVHDHLMFGEGEVDFADVFGALKDVGYAGGVFVELSRHSHDAVEVARRSLDFLKRAAP